MKIFLLAPGPSLTQALCDSLKGQRVGVVNNAYELAPWAEFIAANDKSWWANHPEAMKFKGRKFSANQIKGVEQIHNCIVASQSNSGVVGLEVAKSIGATEIVMLGFDMHGSHFFGTYKNGCKNTDPNRRKIHVKQFDTWHRNNSKIKVFNCTEGTQLKVFPLSKLDAHL